VFFDQGGFLLLQDLFKQVQIYELNTRIFCIENNCRLEDFPEWFFDSPEFLACDYLWLMGIWKPSPTSVDICKKHQGLLGEFEKALPGFREQDIIGSPYSIFDYSPNPLVAGNMNQINQFRKKIKKFGKKLILDFVPNHMAVDTALLDQYPENFLKKESKSICHNSFPYKDFVYYHGRDPYFDGWTDTVQWDFSNSETAKIHYKFLLEISEVCDGVRCDMAMLPLADIFGKTHGKDGKEYWKPIISQIKSDHPNFIFIGEVYWNREYDLQQQGFDFTYDKELYDRLKHKSGEDVLSHLRANIDYQNKSVRFLENHDEERSYHSFNENSIEFNSLLQFLPGAILYHQGQNFGLETKLPVQLARKKNEKIKDNILTYYNRSYHQLMIRKNYDLFYTKLYFSSYELPNQESLFVRSIYYLSKNIERPSLKIYNLEILLFNPYDISISGWLSLDEINKEFIKNLFLDKIDFIDLNTGNNYSKEKDEVLTNGIYVKLLPKSSHWLVTDSDLLKDTIELLKI
jgi:hypothetical protein